MQLFLFEFFNNSFNRLSYFIESLEFNKNKKEGALISRSIMPAKRMRNIVEKKRKKRMLIDTEKELIWLLPI